MMNPRGFRVLVAPLHWGLGHATRCIPLIEQQLSAGNDVIIAAEGGPKALLQQRFPELSFIAIPFMPITYPKDGNMVRHFFWKGPRLVWSIWNEHRLLQRAIIVHHIDRVISDSRFGLWSKKVPSIFVTHQLEIKSPVFQWLINVLNRWVMRRYHEVWVPDYPAKPGLAGELSHPVHTVKHVKYIGPLSRFAGAAQKQEELEWDVLAIISGPEPQRSLFEAEVVRSCIENDDRALILEGKPDQPSSRKIGTITLQHHLSDDDLVNALSRSKRVIARSGYSTIMDMHVLGIKPEYIATPGQTEQAYLARLHSL